MREALPDLPVLAEPLRTRRLLLRAVGEQDLGAYVRVLTDPLVQRHFHGPVEAEVAREAAVAAMGKPGEFCAVLSADDVPVGFLGLSRERRTGDLGISYAFLPEYWNRGYAREAVSAVLGWVFEHVPENLPRIVAVAAEENRRSCHLLEAVGMARMKTTHEHGRHFVVYAMDRQGSGQER